MKKSFTPYLLLLFLFSAVLQAQVWEPVGTAAGISTGTAGKLTLTRDTQDNLWVGYYDVAAAKGSVQKYDQTAGTWSYAGGSPGITDGSATYNSISVDHDGVAYFTNQTPYPALNMEVRSFQNGAWTKLPNPTNGNVNLNTSTVSPDNVLFIANNSNNGIVKKLVNGEWVQVGGSIGFSPLTFLDMVVGTNGKVYVSFNNGGVRVYENDINASEDTAWQPVGGISPLAAAPSIEDYNSSLAIDSQNNLFVAYVSNSAGGNKLNVKKFDGTTWTSLGGENFTSNRVKHTSIAIAANDIVYVAVSNWEDVNLLKNYVLAYNSQTNSWQQAGTGFASEGGGIFNSLAVDSVGNLYLAFQDSGLGKLSVKKLNLALTAAESVDITTEGGVPAAINTDNGTLQLKATVLPA